MVGTEKTNFQGWRPPPKLPELKMEYKGTKDYFSSIYFQTLLELPPLTQLAWQTTNTFKTLLFFFLNLSILHYSFNNMLLKYVTKYLVFINCC